MPKKSKKMAKDRTLENINIQGVGKGRRDMKGDRLIGGKIQEKPTKTISLDKTQYQMLAQKGISWL